MAAAGGGTSGAGGITLHRGQLRALAAAAAHGCTAADGRGQMRVRVKHAEAVACLLQFEMTTVEAADPAATMRRSSGTSGRPWRASGITYPF